LNYQWYKDSGMLSSETNSSLVLMNVGSGDTGTYSVVVSGACGSAATNSASLTVNENVAVLSGPVSVTNWPGTTASFSVTATGTGLNYQWYKDSGALSGETNSSLVLTNVGSGDAGTYSVVVSGVCGSAVTNSASLQLIPEFSIESVSVTNGVVVITWSAVPGRSYKLQYKDTLEGTNWNDVPPNLVATGSKASLTDTVGVAAQRFYRVALLP